jgi:hypothetical protein
MPLMVETQKSLSNATTADMNVIIVWFTKKDKNTTGKI